MTASLGSLNLLEYLTELRETLTFAYQFTKGSDKGYRWMARWRDTQSEVWEVPSTGASVPMEFEWVTLLVWMFPPTWNLPRPLLLGFMEASSCRCDQLLTPFPAPLLSLEDGMVEPKILCSYRGVIREPTQSHLFRKRDRLSVLITWEFMRVLGALGCGWDQRHILE